MAAKKKQAQTNAFADAFNAIGIQPEAPETEEAAFGGDADFGSLFSEEDKKTIRQEFEEAKKKGVEMIDIDLLDPNPLSKYHMRDEDSFESLKELIRTNGFEQGFSIVGKKKPDGRVTILSGHRRTAAAKSIVDEDGNRIITQLPIIYKDFGREVDELEFVTSANLKRADNISDILNMYQLFSEHYDSGDWSKEETEGRGKNEFIARKMGIPETKISNNMFLLRYSPVIWLYIDEGVLSVNDMRKLNTDNTRGKLKNHDEIVKALLESEILKRAGESSEARQAARKEARRILADAKKKYDRKDHKKKKPESAGKLVARITKEITAADQITAEGMSKKEKTAALKEIEKVRKEIDRIETMLREG